eukprot:3907249-Rhodomonas_salina.1
MLLPGFDGGVREYTLSGCNRCCCYAMSGTAIAYGDPRGPVLCCGTDTARCAVALRMVLCGVRG